MDNQETEPKSALNIDGAAQAFGAFLDPVVEEKSAQELENEVLTDLTAEKQEDQPDEEVSSEDDDGVTIEVDGKEVKLSKSELADAYKNGLRQSDYTKKTMEVADARKAAEAETQKAIQERQTYAQNLSKVQAQLEGALELQNQIDWSALLENDPVEYLKQQHLLQQRQALYQQNFQQIQQIEAMNQADQQKYMQDFLQSQQEQLLAKLPEWKDASKQRAEAEAISKYLLEQGFDKDTLANISDHKAILISRKAMLYDAMMAKANAASKKVATAPQRVLKPSVGEKQNLDGRTSAMKQLSKTGKVEDAAVLFGQFL